jgi:hypothetical protein
MKVALAGKSGIPAGSQHLFWLDDKRQGVEDLFLKNSELISEVMLYTHDSSSTLRFGVFVGEAAADDFVSTTSSKPDTLIKEGIENPIGVTFIPNRPHLLLVADFGAHALALCDITSAKVLVKFGTKGNGNGEFERPYGVVCTESDEHGLIIVVSEWSNHRLQVLRMDLNEEKGGRGEGATFEFVRMLGGGEGFERGELRNPLGLCMRKQPAVGGKMEVDGAIERTVLVVEGTNHRVSEFDIFSGECIGTHCELGLSKPYDITPLSDDEGGFAVADSALHNIHIFDNAFKVRAVFGNSTENTLNHTEAEFVPLRGSLGVKNGHFHDPSGLTVDSNGNILVTDVYTKRVQVFSQAGVYLCSLENIDGMSTGQDKSIAWDGGSAGCLAVGDYNAQCVHIWGCRE